jgi:2-dehydropantoate 2-reductase
MKVIILGTGGVGGYYGGLLALHGQEVTFIARGAHLEAIRQDGLQVKSVHGDFHIQPARATDSPAEAGRADLVLLCTKTTSTAAAVLLLPPMIDPHTVVLSLQNGIDAAGYIGSVIGMEHMLGGATWLSSAIEGPGVIRQISQFRRVVVGELDGAMTPRLQAVAEAFRPTGITFETTGDISKVLWTKFVFIAAVSGVGALTRLGIGEYRLVPETRYLLMGIMGEVEAVALALGIELEMDVVEKTLAFIDSSAPGIKASMQRDVEAGKPFELEAIIGVICLQGREYGIPTPIADMIYAALLPLALKAGR